MRSSGSPRAESISTGNSACSPRNCLSSSRPLPSGSITSRITASGLCWASAARALTPSWLARTLKPSCCSQLASSSQSSRSSSISSRSVMVMSVSVAKYSDPLAAASVPAGTQTADDESAQGGAATYGKPQLLLAEQALRLTGLCLFELQPEALIVLAQPGDLRVLVFARGDSLQCVALAFAFCQLLLQCDDLASSVDRRDVGW